MLVSIEPSSPPRTPRPAWLRAPAPVGENYHNLKKLVQKLDLHTVCESAACPNIGDCWNRRTATFMILGNVCTRRCGFCAVQKGAPLAVDYDEPRRVARACAALGLKFAKPTAELRKQFSLPDTTKGAVITEVPQNGPGATQGLRPGDLVIAVGHESVGSLEELQQKVAAARKNGHKNVILRVEREGNTRFIALPFEAG